MPDHSCPKCQSGMETGFVFEQRSTDVQTRPEWGKGEPEVSWWAGVKLPSERHPVLTYRCGRCGYLESYAKAK